MICNCLSCHLCHKLSFHVVKCSDECDVNTLKSLTIVAKRTTKINDEYGSYLFLIIWGEVYENDQFRSDFLSNY
jgi:hypothetical protein